MRRFKCNEDFFYRDTPESFYWAGFIAADGFIGLHKDLYKKLGILLANKDIRHLWKLKRLLNFEGPIGQGFSTIGEKTYPRCTIAITSDQIFDGLTRFGITPRKSLTLRFPKWVEEHPLVHHFIRGYLDGDGFWMLRTRDQQMYVGLLGTKQFLNACIRVLEKNCALCHHRKPSPKENIFEITWSGNKQTKRIRDYLYKDATIDIRLTRKFNIAFDPIMELTHETSHFKPIVGTNIETGKEIIFASVKSVVEKGFHPSCVSNCLHGRYQQHKGFTWKLKET